MSTRVLKLTALVSLGVVLLGGCTSGSARPRPTGSVSLGLLINSGSEAGAEAVRGAELALGLVNEPHPEVRLPLAAAAGLPHLEGAQLRLAVGDTEGDQDAAEPMADELISGQAAGIVLADHESVVANAAAYATRRGVPMVDAATSATRLLDALSARHGDNAGRGRIGVDFGSIGLCHVAAGFTDAMIEFAKGFAIWDLSPGHYILHAAGGSVVDLQGRQLSLDYHLDSLADISEAMGRRQRFVAAGSLALAREIARPAPPRTA